MNALWGEKENWFSGQSERNEQSPGEEMIIEE